MSKEDVSQFSFRLEQNPIYTKLVLVELFLQIQLTEHTESTPALLPFKVSRKECIPSNFSYNQLPDQEIVIGDEELVLELTISQQPCEYTISYSAFLRAEGENETTPLPDFIKYDSELGTFTIAQTSQDDVGEYDVIIKATL